MTFEEFWISAIENLRARLVESGNEIRLENWKADTGPTGEEFQVMGASDDGIDCMTIYGGKKINLPKEDMEVLYGMWDDYVAGEANRMDLIDAIPRPAYCVAVMKYLKDDAG